MVRVQIPEGVIGVKPMPKPGWTLSVTRGTYAKSYRSHGKTITEGPTEIVWSGGSLADDNYDEFTFMSFISGDFTVGQAVYFPTVQECAKQKIHWIEIPAASQSSHDLKVPAPALQVIADGAMVAQAHTDHGINHSGHGISGGDTFNIGDISVVAPWTRATPGGAKIAGGYLKIMNKGKTDERLLKVTTSVSDRVEIHEMSVTEGVMRMRPLPNGLTIKPGETVELKPGGYHIMFMDIKAAFKQGDAVRATLTFEKAGTLDVTFKIDALGATGEPAHKH